MEGAVFSLIVKVISYTAKAEVDPKFLSGEKYKVRGAAKAKSTILKVSGVV